MCCRARVRPQRERPELSLARCKRVGLQHRCAPVGVEANQGELAVGRDQHLPVLLEVLQDLLAAGHFPHGIAGWFHLEGAAQRKLARQWLGALLELAGDKQAAVGDARADVG